MPLRFRLPPAFRIVLAVGLASLLPAAASAQSSRPHHAARPNVTALLVSDIHFDPFHDPAKVPQLANAPASQWSTILAAPDSPDQAAAFAALEHQCHARGVDTPWPLFQSALQAMPMQAPRARFMTVSGDLIAHAFPCRFAANFPAAQPGQYQAFVEKTIAFVVDQLRAAFPGMPVYVALGNNDSACADYQLDPNSAFLHDLAPIVADALPPSDRAAVLARFPVDGAYSVSLAPALPRTRLIVLDDLFFSRRYRTCAGADDPAPAAASLAWLRQQLVQAQRSGQRVWFMAHIPPGVDPYSTMTKFRNVCAGESPVSFLSSEGLAEQLVQSAPIVRLAIFAHTHMDELRLLTPPAHSASSPSSSVAVKLVPSISPVDGNNPSFTVARIDPATAVLQDYQVIAASNQTGIGTTWSVEYDYGQAYHEAQFSPHALAQLIAEFENDPHAQSAPSDEYVRHYFVGQSVRELTPFWPQYVCSLAHDTAAAYRACVCSNTH